MDPALERDNQAVVNEWIRFGLRLGVSAALHPFEYSKVLIQLGYEPIPPRPGKTLFGSPTLILPNIFQYAGHIKKMDGFIGCYRGLAPKLVGSIVGSICSERIADKLGLAVVIDEDTKDDADLSDFERFSKFQLELKRDIIIHVSGIVITHPFHVISIRMMAQFIGRETSYSSILGSIGEIWRNDGILGFFAGVMPKIFCDIACLTLTSSTVYMANKYLIRDKESRQYFASFTQFLFSCILYPLQVVSTCMTVSGSNLSAGKPPFMPVYEGWVDCWNDLQARGELKRGSSLFWRSIRPNPAFASRASIAPMPTLAKYN
ncbi:unnamed protein product [Hermetia illucens]|uniref:Uncharacterized protein n=1 Tax=Hermetia illucens TaxID=343691 RepID=A0A7R8YQI4_HERIL|nr:mitochondrial carrier homolog 2 [Hermetia illucens]CAD7081906.1 unnamed protein product [Hermetia illucens]